MMVIKVSYAETPLQFWEHIYTIVFDPHGNLLRYKNKKKYYYLYFIATETG